MSDPYYQRFARYYLRDVRRLVPRYGEMTRTLLETAALLKPRRLLDLGAGVGHLDRLLLRRFPQSHLTAVEVSPAMLRRLRRHLSPYSSRALILATDLRHLGPDGEFDLMLSNLVLHNLERKEKRSLLQRLADHLQEGGLFLWGDLVRHHHPALGAHWEAWRREFAARKGVDPDFLEWNFRKENRQDHPLPVEEMISLGKRAGFGQADLLWCHDSFALLAFWK